MKLSSADRVLFPDDGITKGELFDYYDRVADAIVPHLKDRPFTMKRWREGLPGGSFFQKQAPKGMPDWIPTRQFRTWPRGGKGESRLVDFPLVESREALLWMVQMHCIDMNAWYSRIDKPERPDWVLFDLDPPEEPDAFSLCVRVAHYVRGALGDTRPCVVCEDERRRRHPRARADHAPVDLRGDVRVRRAAVAPARGGASRRGDDRVAEEETLRCARRPSAERAREDDRVGLLGAAEARRARVDAVGVVGADGGHRSARLFDERCAWRGSRSAAICSSPCCTAGRRWRPR